MGVREIVLEGGKVAGLETKQCISVRESDGRFNPQYDATSAVAILHSDSIIVAIGHAYDGSLSISENNSNGIFTAGDMSSGPSTVIQAISSAQKAVNEIESYIGARASRPPADETSPLPAESFYENIPRTRAGHVPAMERIQSIQVEDVAGLSLVEIEMEARRCLNCGCLAVGPSDLAIALVALNATVVTDRRTLEAQDFFAATASSSTILEKDELIKEIRIPKPPRDARQSYIKFTLREPVDFALVSVAAMIASKKGVCFDARIVLGAVAPAPLRARAAEEAIKGKPIDEYVAAEAANLALAEAAPLSMNAYKIEIARTLVKRLILGQSD